MKWTTITRLVIARSKATKQSGVAAVALDCFASLAMTAAAALAAMLLAPGTAGAADAIYGVWGRDGHERDKLEFFDCAGKLCARGIRPLPDGSPPPQILRSAARTEPNSWQGELFNPENGKLYKGTITLESPTKMTLKGCLVAFLCQSESWTKISGPTRPGKGSDAQSGQDAKPAQDAKPDAKPGPDARPTKSSRTRNESKKEPRPEARPEPRADPEQDPASAEPEGKPGE